MEIWLSFIYFASEIYQTLWRLGYFIGITIEDGYKEVGVPITCGLFVLCDRLYIYH